MFMKKPINLIAPAPALVMALVAASVALPAAAQSYGQSYGPPRGPSYHAPAHWQPISQRRITLDRRIDQGVRNGSISRREANRVRSELNSLVRLETSYRRGGLTLRERADLDRRFVRLENSIRYQRPGRR